MHHTPPTLNIIVPCFNEEATIERLVASLHSLMSSLISSNYVSLQSRAIIVDDGSTDATWQLIKTLDKKYRKLFTGIKLTRNQGHQNAIIAGLDFALARNADITITIDADLQDDPDIIPEMIAKYNEGYEIVYGVRANRSSDSGLKRLSASSFYRIMHKWEPNIICEHADFRLMSRRAVTALLQYDERNIFLRGIVPLIGLKSAQISYTRAPRIQGYSKYPWKKMINFAIEGITSFSIVPIRMIFIIGIIFLICTFAVTIYVMAAILIGRNIPGWASMMLSLWFIGSLILIALGVIGEYVGKIYLEVKHRPRYFIDCTTDDDISTDNHETQL